MGTDKEGEGAVLMVGPAVPVSKNQIEIMYWYRDRRSGSAECIMTGKGRGMEEQEENAVTDGRAQLFAK